MKENDSLNVDYSNLVLLVLLFIVVLDWLGDGRKKTG